MLVYNYSKHAIVVKSGFVPKMPVTTNSESSDSVYSGRDHSLHIQPSYLVYKAENLCVGLLVIVHGSILV